MVYVLIVYMEYDNWYKEQEKWQELADSEWNRSAINPLVNPPLYLAIYEHIEWLWEIRPSIN